MLFSVFHVFHTGSKVRAPMAAFFALYAVMNDPSLGDRSNLLPAMPELLSSASGRSGFHR